MRRWVEHFEELQNRPVYSYPLDNQPVDSDLPVDCGVTTKEEICNAIKEEESAERGRKLHIHCQHW